MGVLVYNCTVQMASGALIGFLNVLSLVKTALTIVFKFFGVIWRLILYTKVH